MNIKNIFKKKKLNFILVSLTLILSSVLIFEFFYFREYYFSCIGDSRHNDIIVIKDNPEKSYETEIGNKRITNEIIRIKVHGFGFVKTINYWNKNNCSVQDETEIYCFEKSKGKPKGINYDFEDYESFDFLNLKYSKSKIYSYSDNKGWENEAFELKCTKLNKPFD